MDIVEVTWNDAATCAHVISMEEAAEHGDMTARTVGYLTKQDKEAVTLVMTLFPDINDRKFKWTIPKGMIKKIRKLGKV